ncbi:MAG: hypothetical protein ACRERU_09810 [Methylococcales bacterium]
MPISVRLDPALEVRLNQEVQRLGVTQSDFVKDALERVSGFESPASLLQQVRNNTPMGNSDASLYWLAVETRIVEIMTVGRNDFERYRLPDGQAFSLL